jgi:hypothetical protein
MLEPPYYIDYSELRLMIHSMVTSKYFDLAISAVIGLNVITMAMEFYMMPRVSQDYVFSFSLLKSLKSTAPKSGIRTRIICSISGCDEAEAKNNHAL